MHKFIKTAAVVLTLTSSNLWAQAGWGLDEGIPEAASSALEINPGLAGRLGDLTINPNVFKPIAAEHLDDNVLLPLPNPHDFTEECFGKFRLENEGYRWALQVFRSAPTSADGIAYGKGTLHQITSPNGVWSIDNAVSLTCSGGWFRLERYTESGVQIFNFRDMNSKDLWHGSRDVHINSPEFNMPFDRFVSPARLYLHGIAAD